ncbi:hypothetical protein WT25_01970 [Burkholderia territorii]|nr:hypothetical protein WT25_01970 [Burkholderia territorii]
MEQHRQMRMNCSFVRTGRDGIAKNAFRFSASVGELQQCTKPAKYHAMAGIQCQYATVASLCLIESATVVKQQAEIAAGVHIIGPNLNGPSIATFRFISFACHFQDDAKIVQRLRMIGVQGDCNPIMARSICRLSSARRNNACGEFRMRGVSSSVTVQRIEFIHIRLGWAIVHNDRWFILWAMLPTSRIKQRRRDIHMPHNARSRAKIC